MLVASQALAIWGTHFLPAGVAAVFGSSSPLFLALFAWALLHQPLTGRQIAGVAVGFAGLALMGLTSATGDDFRPVGAVLALTGTASWAAGSLLAPRLALPRDPLISLATQLTSAGAVLGSIVAMSGIAATTRLARVPPSAGRARVSRHGEHADRLRRVSDAQRAGFDDARQYVQLCGACDRAVSLRAAA